MERTTHTLCFVHANRMTARGDGELYGDVEFCIKGLSDPEEGDLVYGDTFVKIYVEGQFDQSQSAWSVSKDLAKKILLERLRDLVKKVEEIP